ncbi:hypothetical protein BJ741DRAFT_518782, partial [Chytriomyces cf. hyalinus JEL632]
QLQANGRQVFHVPLTLFNDDTSGNSSQKWNKYESWSFTFAGLPFKKTQLQENTNFICTSKHASAIESTCIITDCLRELRKGILVYDVVLCEEVFVTASVLQILGDNPALSSIVSHTGLTSSTPCHFCNI